MRENDKVSVTFRHSLTHSFIVERSFAEADF